MSLPEDRKRRWHYHTFSFRKENLTKGEDDMESNAFLNDLMSKMKLPEAKGKKKAEQSESVAQILAAMPCISRRRTADADSGKSGSRLCCQLAH